MKHWLLFSMMIFFGLKSSCQPVIEHVTIGKEAEKKSSYFPHLGKYYEGEIALSRLSSEKLEVAEGWLVISFSVSYPSGNQNKIIHVKGNRIPEFVVDELYSNSLGEMIFITNIIAFNEENEKVHLTPMNLIPIK